MSIKQQIDETGLTVKQFSEATGINRNTLYKLTSEHSGYRASRRIKKLLELGLNWVNNKKLEEVTK
jgi:predicted transcriptional regulator